jgi:hypothetical protein
MPDPRRAAALVRGERGRRLLVEHVGALVGGHRERAVGAVPPQRVEVDAAEAGIDRDVLLGAPGVEELCALRRRLLGRGGALPPRQLQHRTARPLELEPLRRRAPQVGGDVDERLLELVAHATAYLGEVDAGLLGEARQQRVGDERLDRGAAQQGHREDRALLGQARLLEGTEVLGEVVDRREPDRVAVGDGSVTRVQVRAPGAGGERGNGDEGERSEGCAALRQAQDNAYGRAHAAIKPGDRSKRTHPGSAGVGVGRDRAPHQPPRASRSSRSSST